MLVMKIPDGGHVEIYDTLDGASPTIKIVITPQGSIGIEADRRFAIRRSNAKAKAPKVASGRCDPLKGGTDAQPNFA